MGFFHGKNTKVLLNGYNMSSFFDSVDLPITADTVETTVFSLSDKTYVLGNKTAAITAEGFFDGTSSQSDVILRGAFASTNRWSYYPHGDTIGYNGYGMEAINNAYQVQGSVTGAVRARGGGMSQVGNEYIVSLHNLAESTLSTSATAVNNSAATTNGASAYLHVTANDGTGLVAIVEHSTSGSTWDTLLTFDTCTGGRASERDTSTGDTIKQYARATWTSTGAATFQIGLCRLK